MTWERTRYHKAPLRAQTWDYGNAALYFITICTEQKVRYFGEIANGKLEATEMGAIASSEWYKTPKCRPENLSSITRGYKSAVTTYARKHRIDFQWQTLYYDRIIRSMEELNRISQYICDNPKNWNSEKNRS